MQPASLHFLIDLLLLQNFRHRETLIKSEEGYLQEYRLPICKEWLYAQLRSIAR